MNRVEFERVTPEQVGIASGDISWLLDRLEEPHTQMHGIMIMRDSKVCAEGWWAPYAPGLHHGLQSLTKTYAATAVGIACTEGLLDLDERVISLFPGESPSEPGPFLEQLRVRDVLMMGCGMEQMPVPGRDWVRDFLHTPVLHKPGTVFMYNSLGSSFLGEIVKKVSGQNLHDFLKPRLFDVIGIDAENLLWLRHPDGMEVGGGGLFACTEDNLRLMKLYLDGGVWEGQRILSEEYVRLATSLQIETASERAVNPPAEDNFVGYGFQIWQCRFPGAYRADGAMGQFSVCVPNLDMVISINETAIGAEGIQITLDYLWEFLRRIDPSVKQLPEDPAASSLLRRRLSHLAIEAPAWRAYDPQIERYSNLLYVIHPDESGRLPGLETQIMQDLIGTEGTEGMTSLSFSFSRDNTVLTFEQDGASREVRVALDGTRAENELLIKGEVVRRVLVSGCICSADTVEITALWPETCYTKTLRFHFEDRSLKITAATFPLTTTIPGGTRKNMEAQEFTAEALVQ